MNGIVEQKTKKKGKSSLIYTPDVQKVKPAVVVIGYLLRAAVTVLASSGLAIFFFSAFRFSGMASGWILLASLFFCAVFAFMALGKKQFFIGLPVSFLGLILPQIFIGLSAGTSPITYLLRSPLFALNAVFNRITSAGYQIPFTLSCQCDESVAGLMQVGGMLLLTYLICAVMSVSLARKVRLIPMLLLGTILCGLVFTYNFSNSNWGFSLIIVAFCAILVLRHYDVCFKGKEQTVRASALGGYTGFAAALLSLIIIAIPAIRIHSSWDEIGGLSDTMQIARSYMASILIGEKPDWSGVDAHGKLDSLGTRSTEANKKSFNGETVLKVYSDYNLPIYLRAWIAVDWDDDVWRACNADELEAYEERFGEDFNPETITDFFLEQCTRESLTLSERRKYDEHLEYGFVTTRVSVDTVDSDGNLLFFPSRFDAKTGLLTFVGARKEDEDAQAYGGEVINYYDGLRITSWLNFNKEYTALAYLPVYRSADYVSSMRKAQENYQRNVALIREFYELSSEVPDGEYTLEQFLTERQITIDDWSNYQFLRNFASENKKIRRELFENYIDLEADYSDFVDERYTEKHGGKIVTDTAFEIVSSLIGDGLTEYQDGLNTYYNVDFSVNFKGYEMTGGEGLTKSGVCELFGSYAKENFELQYKLILAVVDYLGENCTYTLNPQAGMPSGKDSVEKFLSTEKQGYCVQFATASTFLLREFGIATRYVEGYYISNLSYNRDTENRFALYSATASDRNMHAWIEVYSDGIGWLTYETTPPNYDAMYKIYEQGGSSGGSSGGYDPGNITPLDPDETDDFGEDETDAETETGDETTGGADPKEALKVLLPALGVIAVIVVIILLIRKEQRRREKLRDAREELLIRARRSGFTSVERRKCGRELCEVIRKEMKVAGTERKAAEFPTEFGNRIDALLKEQHPESALCFTEAVELMEKAEFGTTLEEEELCRLADFCEALSEETLSGMNLFERYYYHTLTYTV